MDISAQLRTYEIEYQVLQKRWALIRPWRTKTTMQEVVVTSQRHNRSLLEQLERNE